MSALPPDPDHDGSAPPAGNPDGPGGLSRAGTVAMAFGLTLCVGVGDALTGTEISFILLYLAPIAFATWFVSLGAGVAVSIWSAAVSAAADVIGRIQEGHPESTAVLAWNVAVQLGTFMALVLLLEALRSRLEREQLLARTDALTRVPNRRAFIEAATLELERARRSGRPITFAFVDCDDFKYVNDALGHAQGDALLVVVAQTLRGATRTVDAVARLGGDEFGLLLPQTDAEVARSLLTRVRGMLDAAMARNAWNVGFSIGAATFTSPPRSVDEMMARADELMYEAKRTGKGQIRVEVISAPAEGAASASQDGTASTG